MLPSVAPLSEVDRRILAAHRDLGVARASFARSPSGAAITACQAAEARLDELLDARLDLMSTARPPGVVTRRPRVPDRAGDR
ncbi:hypothetical protein DQ238_15065 [Geodermatophilus sp. TF02-6]|uniref:hypothetical protein n=1 Tax=Geodermatophilus sp. TF02-6 TaxID=2250575 RepID=UPI000DEA38F9|nr:hypothetical protein [Geodermatophilus sp. TF02-6]RBY77216.1 hypothetical protein DQ238_15065 [Geodermatophilus sp. TF02-6]